MGVISGKWQAFSWGTLFLVLVMSDSSGDKNKIYPNSRNGNSLFQGSPGNQN